MQAVEFGPGLLRHELQVSCEQSEVSELAQRAQRDVQKPPKLRLTSLGRSLGNIRSGGGGGASHLRRHPIQLRLWKTLSNTVSQECQVVAVLPSDESLVWPHA